MILAILSLYNAPKPPFHQVSAQSDLLFGIRSRLKNLMMVAMAATLDI